MHDTAAAERSQLDVGRHDVSLGVIEAVRHHAARDPRKNRAKVGIVGARDDAP